MGIRAERSADLGSINAVARAAFRDGLGHIPAALPGARWLVRTADPAAARL